MLAYIQSASTDRELLQLLVMGILYGVGVVMSLLALVAVLMGRSRRYSLGHLTNGTHANVVARVKGQAGCSNRWVPTVKDGEGYAVFARYSVASIPGYDEVEFVTSGGHSGLDRLRGCNRNRGCSTNCRCDPRSRSCECGCGNNWRRDPRSRSCGCGCGCGTYCSRDPRS